MSALFGHVKGAFTGALKERPGLLKAADGGVLFLDEIGELGGDEQAMMLHALEEKTFLPLGADHEEKSDFQLIAGTNRDLAAEVRLGRFREDLFARTNLWTFRLPGLCERREDIEPNLQFELEQFANRTGNNVTISKEARDSFLAFGNSRDATWIGNFRDLNGAIIRMSTLAPGGRISVEVVQDEIERLRGTWKIPTSSEESDLIAELPGPEMVGQIDLFDRLQLESVIRVCRNSISLSDAGRKLFGVTREKKGTVNDADRLRKYLARYGVEWKKNLRVNG